MLFESTLKVNQEVGNVNEMLVYFTSMFSVSAIGYINGLIAAVDNNLFLLL